MKIHVAVMSLCVSMYASNAYAVSCNNIKMTACYANTLTAINMTLALPLVKLAKDRGAFRDVGNCEEIARDGGKFSAVLANFAGAGPELGPIVSIIAGTCGECTCRLAY